jgi:hypothetical protein
MQFNVFLCWFMSNPGPMPNKGPFMNTMGCVSKKAVTAPKENALPIPLCTQRGSGVRRTRAGLSVPACAIARGT